MRRLTWLMVLAVLALFATSCGDSDDTAEQPEPVTTTAAVLAETPTTTAVPSDSDDVDVVREWTKVVDKDWTSYVTDVGVLPEDAGFVAVTQVSARSSADDPAVLWSPDGLEWQDGDPERLLPQRSARTMALTPRSVAAGAETVVVLDDAAVWVGDPRTGRWAPIPLDTSGIDDEIDLGMLDAHDNEALVVASLSEEPPPGDDLRLPTGIAVWAIDLGDGSSTRTLISDISEVNAIEWFDGRWVMMTTTEVPIADGGPSDKSIWASPDGESWTEVDLPGRLGGDGIPMALTAGSAGLVVTRCTMGFCDMWHSANATDWEQVIRGPLLTGTTYSAALGYVTLYEDDEDQTRGPVVWTSTDGTTWRDTGPASTAPSFTVVLAASGDRLLVLDPSRDSLGSSLWLWSLPTTASDAEARPSVEEGTVEQLAWSRVPHDEVVFGGPGDQIMRSVTVGGPGFVAVGVDDLSGVGPGPSEASAAVWTSLDGLRWSRVPADPSAVGDGDLASVAEGGPGLVAVGYGLEGWVSADGFDWLPVTAFEELTVRKDVIAGGPGLVAVGRDLVRGAAAVWTSPDGLSWTRVPHDEAVFGGPDGAGMSSVTAGGPGLVAVGSIGDDSTDGPLGVWTSVDGLTWSRVPDDPAVVRRVVSSVTAGGPGLVAVGRVGDDAAVWTSADGTTWSRVPHDEAVFGGSFETTMHDVTVVGDELVAVGHDDDGVRVTAAVWTSPDGTTWSRVPHDEAVFGGSEDLSMHSVTASDAGVVAVGVDSRPFLQDPADQAAVWFAAIE